MGVSGGGERCGLIGVETQGMGAVVGLGFLETWWEGIHSGYLASR